MSYKEKKNIHCIINEILYNEIKDSQLNLNEKESKKKQGVKRKKYNFQEASYKLGMYIKNNRKKSLMKPKT